MPPLAIKRSSQRASAGLITGMMLSAISPGGIQQRSSISGLDARASQIRLMKTPFQSRAEAGYDVLTKRTAVFLPLLLCGIFFMITH
jgi:hypothetical protein